MTRCFLRGLFTLLLTAACAGPLDDDGVFNEPPSAALRAPVIAPTETPVLLDAAASYDLDGDPLTYVFEFNDGTPSLPSASPSVSHVFRAPGLYTVRVRVTDPLGAQGVASQDVAARDDYPVEPSFCTVSEECVVGDECELGVCYATGGALE